MALYTYPAIDGYLWNAKQKIHQAFSFPFSAFAIVVDTATTYVSLPRELSEAEKAALDKIMAEPCHVPDPKGTAFKIKDLWSMRDWFRKEIGLYFTFWFEPETDGERPCHIHLHFDRELTPEEKAKVVSVYQGMISDANPRP